MKESRNGKHKEGNVLLGAMVDPRKKAIAIVTAAVLAKERRQSLTQTDIIWLGIKRLAQSVGVVDGQGDPTPQYQDAVAVATEFVINGNKSNRGTRGGARRSK